MKKIRCANNMCKNKIKNYSVKNYTKDCVKSNNGFTLLELILALAILSIAAASVYTLIRTGSVSYNRAYERSMARNNARIAVSFVNIKIKQNDSSESVKIVDDSNGSIGKNSSSTIRFGRNKPYTWVYYDNTEKKLKEYKGDSFVYGNGVVIAEIAGFKVTEELSGEMAAIEIKAVYSDNGEVKELVSLATLRSE